MLSREELIKNKELLEDKACGCLSGLAIGDSFGDAARMESNRVNYGITTDFNNKAAWSTDDTEFAMLTAQTLIECKGKLTSDVVVKAWLKNVAIQDEFKRGGASEIKAAENLLRGLRPPESGRFSTYHMSDGTAMRIPPVGVFCAGDIDKAKEMAKIDAEVSHYRDGVWGAQAVSVAVALAMVDADMDTIINEAVNCLPKDSWVYYNMIETFKIIEKNKDNKLKAWMEVHDFLRSDKWATTAEAIPSAFAVLKLYSGSFKEAVVLAGNFGRDADTIGAVVGAILGAKYGLKAIPKQWVEKTRYPSGTCLDFTKNIDIIKVAKEIAALIK